MVEDGDGFPGAILAEDPFELDLKGNFLDSRLFVRVNVVSLFSIQCSFDKVNDHVCWCEMRIESIEVISKWHVI